jgi:2-polyprenyl-6-methoxyphenol hydroxylase-like FAD-dependent oxidoreductase
VELEVDALVVGARIAGSITAAALGRLGYRVLLVDRARFPSPTLSTHFFRGGRLCSVLDSLGVLDDVLALGSPKLICDYNYEGDDPTPDVTPPQDPGEIGFALSVRRQTLDHLLIRRATAEPTVEFREGMSVRSLAHEGERMVGATLSDGDTVRAAIVVGADGRDSSVAAHVQAIEQIREPATRAMYYRYFHGFTNPAGAEPDGAEFSLIGDELVYAFPSDAGTTCVALSVSLGDFAAMHKDAERAFHERIASHPGLAPRLARCTLDGRLLGCGPKDHLVRIPAGPGWALVGDASLHQDPWTGNGMDNAGVHATFLAAAIDDWLGGRVPEDEAFDRYHAQRDEHALTDFRETVELGRDLRQVASA